MQTLLEQIAQAETELKNFYAENYPPAPVEPKRPYPPPPYKFIITKRTTENISDKCGIDIGNEEVYEIPAGFNGLIRDKDYNEEYWVFCNFDKNPNYESELKKKEEIEEQYKIELAKYNEDKIKYPALRDAYSAEYNKRAAKVTMLKEELAKQKSLQDAARYLEIQNLPVCQLSVSDFAIAAKHIRAAASKLE